jgi:glycosyltransferase involved in cell wall biosynthesis
MHRSSIAAGHRSGSSMKLSIVTVTLNAAQHLPQLIASLRAQTRRDFEWVVMDGGSSDGTLDLLARASDLPLVWRSEADFGIYDALNKALKLARGEHYLVVGADDVLDSAAVEGFVRLIEQTGADIVTTSVRVGAHRLVDRPRGPTWLRGPRAHVTSHAVGTAFRRSLHERVGYYVHRYPITADLLFIAHAVQAGARVARGSFVAGTYAGTGISATDAAGVMSEFFRVQLEVEPNRLLQVGIHVLRLLKNCPQLLRRGR